MLPAPGDMCDCGVFDRGRWASGAAAWTPLVTGWTGDVMEVALVDRERGWAWGVGAES